MDTDPIPDGNAASAASGRRIATALATAARGLLATVLPAAVAACGGSDGPTEPDPDPGPAPTDGTVRVTTSTVAGGLDEDGFRVVLDGTDERAIAPDDTVAFEGLAGGDHTVELSGLAAGCSVEDGAAREVSVAADDTTTVAFAATCGLRDRILFVSGRDGNDEIYVLAADGSGIPRRLTDDPARDYAPSVSPDGSRVVFVSARDSSIRVGNEELFVVEADGSEPPVQLTEHTADDFDPAWSPDGTRIAFSSLRDGGGPDVYVTEADGSGTPLRLTEHAASDHSPAWSPDGTRLVFVSARDGGDPDLYVVPADGSGTPTRLTTDEAADIQPDWSPGGSFVAFTSDRDGVAEIYRVCANGANPPERLTETAADVSDVQPDWSPDGSRIAFASNRDGELFDLYVMAPDGSDTPLRLTEAGAVHPAWSPQTSSGPAPVPGPSEECQVAAP